ncbi:glycosyltransferase [Azospirillum sp. ST 5-10]|uniref:glycosyltransferase family 2 protein n=1 Tax=unclassified Azospirillum TaxID=2630922 RepID=UPI003F49E25C
MPEVLVSVVIPVLDDPSHLARAVDSLQAQTLGAPEVVVVTPESVAEAAKARLSAHRHRVRHLTVPDTAGPAAPLALGLAECRGTHVAWLAPGDACAPRRFEAQHAALAADGGMAVACCSTQAVDGDGRVTGTSPLGAVGGSALWSLLAGGIDPATLLVPRRLLDAVGPVDPRFAQLHELELAVRLAARHPFRAVEAPLLRRAAPRSAAAGPATAELERIWERLLDSAGPEAIHAQASFALTAFGRAWRCLLERPVPAARDRLVRLAAERLGPADLAVGVLAGAGRPPDASLASRLGVPRAAVLAIAADRRRMASAAAELMARATASRLVLIDGAAPPPPGGLAELVLHAEAFNLDACLAGGDDAPLPPGEGGSTVTGCLFRRSPLEVAAAELANGEARFWTAFRRLGRVGALPAPRGAGATGPAEATAGAAAGIGHLVDHAWYREQYPDVATAGIDPTEHYWTVGWRESRDPNAWFSTTHYVRENPDCVEAGRCPLDHFIVAGAARGRRPSPQFDVAWYSRRYLGADTPTARALHHFLTVGEAAGCVPDPVLDTPAAAQELAALPAGQRAERMRRLIARARVREARLAALVDADWYRAEHPDVAAANVDPLSHYLTYGWREGRDPNPWFDGRSYQAANPEVARNNLCPLLHFLDHGAAQGRRPHPGFDLGWYSARHLAGAPPSAEALVHFLTVGLAAGAVPAPFLDHPSVRQALREAPAERRPALLARMLAFEADARSGPLPWREADADLWPVLLRRGYPEEAVPVLIHVDGRSEASRRAAVAASRVLPLDEAALILADDGDGAARLGSVHPAAPCTLRLRLPEDTAVLQALIAALRCRRAATVEGASPDSAVQRALRAARLPLHLNGLDRTEG